jgi:DNA repair protein SbcD/Mre11
MVASPLTWKSNREDEIGVFRFVHAADIHLDSPLRSLALRDPALAELVGTAARSAFVRVVDLCLEERVDVLLIAGDLYDGEQTSMKTARFLAEQLRRLENAAVRVLIIRGNHDCLSKVTKELVLPDTVKVFGGWAGTEQFTTTGGRPVAIHGLSFAQPKAPESLLSKYKPPNPEVINIGMLHTSLGGSPGHDDYSPCSVAELEAMGYDYWALGHIHKRFVSTTRSTIVMPGNIQGRDINEAGPKSVTLVTVDDTGAIELKERVVSPAEFHRLAVDVGGVDDWADLVRAVRKSLQDARATTASDHLIARVVLYGQTSLSWRLRADRELLTTEAENIASEVESAWVEKIEVQATDRLIATSTETDPLTELHELIQTDVLLSDAFLQEVGELTHKLRASLPVESRQILGTSEEEMAEVIRAAAEHGAEEVLARLRTMSSRGAV